MTIMQYGSRVHRLRLAGRGGQSLRDGFTLIEVMIVVIIIVALAAMIAPHLMDIPDRMKIQIVSGDMKTLDTVLKVYRLENGFYPLNLGSLLRVPPSVQGRTEPYLVKEPLDPWGEWYQYKYPGVKSLSGYDIHSMGPNRRDDGGENDDIANWKSEQK